MAFNSNKTVYLISVATAQRKLAKVNLQGAKTVFYLSHDYFSYAQIRSQLGDQFHLQMLQDKFHTMLKKKQPAYLKFCRNLAKQYDPDIWWRTHFASRNAASTPFLRHLIYLCCALQITKETNESLVFISESPALLQTIEEILKSKGESVKRIRCLNDWLTRLLLLIKLMARGLIFLKEMISNFWIVKRLKFDEPPIASKPRVLLRSWFSKGSLDANGVYDDRNFGVLVDWFQKKGVDVWISPMFFNLDKKLSEYLTLMKKSRTPFLLAETYLNWVDIPRLLWRGIRELELAVHRLTFEELPVGALACEAHWQTSLYPELLQWNSIDLVLKRLRKRELAFDSFFYPMENNVVEKTFLRAVRKYYPNAGAFGFQHTVWYKEQLGMYLTSEELGEHPLPDRIICSGEAYPDILMQAGFPRNLPVLGPNLRFQYVNQESAKRRSFKGEKGAKNLLILLTFDFNNGLEILDQLKDVLKKINHGKIYIKYHPLNSRQMLETYLAFIHFPKYEWAEGGMADWLERSDAVIVTGGSIAILESIGEGVPVIRFKPQNNFYFEPFWNDYYLPVSQNTAELRQAIHQAYELSDSELDLLKQFGQQIKDEYFEPVSETKLNVFLDLVKKRTESSEQNGNQTTTD